jgi:hypothetical protein
VDSVCQLLKKFFAKSRGEQGLPSYLLFLFDSQYIRTKGILKYNRKFLEEISSDQKGGVGTPLPAETFRKEVHLTYKKKSLNFISFEVLSMGVFVNAMISPFLN